jgi:hypothetical protein
MKLLQKGERVYTSRNRKTGFFLPARNKNTDYLYASFSFIVVFEVPEILEFL